MIWLSKWAFQLGGWGLGVAVNGQEARWNPTLHVRNGQQEPFLFGFPGRQKDKHKWRTGHHSSKIKTSSNYVKFKQYVCCNIAQSWLCRKKTILEVSIHHCHLTKENWFWISIGNLKRSYRTQCFLGDGYYKLSSCLISKETVRSIRYCQARQVEWLAENP